MVRVRPGAAWRWAVVTAVVAALVAAPLAVAALPSRDADVTAARLLQQVRASAGVPWSGYAEATGRLVLPAVRELGAVAGLLGGTTRLRVWWRGPHDWRVDDLTVGDEDDTYALRAGTLTWRSGERRAVAVRGEPAVRLPQGRDLVPGALARRLLADLGPEDVASRTGSRRVAGVDALGLAVAPHDPASTVARVEVWVEPGTGLPLEVDVTARGAATPVLRTRVMDLSLGSPSRSVTAIPDTVRSGATAAEVQSVDIAAAVDRFAPFRLPDTLAGLPRRARPGEVGGRGGAGAYGTGLTLLVALPLPEGQAVSVLRRLDPPSVSSVPVPGGEAELVTTPLASLLVVHTDGGRGYLLGGAVRPAVLTRAARQLLAHPPPVRVDWQPNP